MASAPVIDAMWPMRMVSPPAGAAACCAGAAGAAGSDFFCSQPAAATASATKVITREKRIGILPKKGV